MLLARPFIKFLGGKTQLLPELLKRVPPSYGTYHEPFLGGGALFFALQPRRAVLSDANERLIRTFKAVRDDVDGVIETLRDLPNDKVFFLRKRAEDPDDFDDVGCAAWFIYLNKTCFNGLYRVNKAGKFNVPFGRYSNPKIVDEENLRACSAALKHASIRHADFRNSLEFPARSDFCYMDPPYVPLSKTSSFTSYTPEKFTHEDQKYLALSAKCMKEDGVHVLLSNSSAPSVVEELYPSSFDIEVVQARRSINSKGDRRGLVREFLIR